MFTDDRSTDNTNAAVAAPLARMLSAPQPNIEPAPAYSQNAFDNQPPANNSANAGPVKSGLRGLLMGMIQNFSYGAGQAMKRASGLPTDAEQAMQMAQTAHLNAQTQLTQQQAAM